MLPSALVRLGVVALVLGVAGVQAAQFRVPLRAKPPSIDGKIDPAEWRLAAGFDGFAFKGKLDRRRARGYVAATKTHLFLAIASQLPAEGPLKAQVAKDTVKVVFDDSIEVWVDPTPGSEHGHVYQMLANPVGRVGYKHHARGREKAKPTWRGAWQIAHGFHAGWWHVEIAVPLEGIAPGRTADQGAWGINLCRNWKEPWAFSSIGGGGYAPTHRFVFAPDALAIRHESRADAFVGDLHHALIIHNPTKQPATVKARLEITRDAMPGLRQDETLAIAPGKTRELAIQTKDDATRKYQLSARVASADGKTVLYDRSFAWRAGEPWRWVTSEKEVLPIDFQFAYYPYEDRMRVLADVRNLPEKATLDRLVCTVRKKGSKRAIKSIVFDQLAEGRQEQAFDLPKLDGEYEIAMKAEGTGVPAGELVKPFERTVFDWERKGLGTGTKVYPPFTPIETEGKKVSTVLREHTMNDLGLWDQVVAAGKPLLAAPMRLGVKPGRAASQAKGLTFLETHPHRATARADANLGDLDIQVRSTWDYDGTMRADLTLSPRAGTRVSSLALEIPLRDEMAPMIHAMGDGIRNTIYARVPEGEGVVWDASQCQVSDFPRNWCSYIYVGSPVRGLCWFAENDAGWSWDREKPNLDLVRKDGQLILRVHLINQPTVIDQPRTITFGLLAAPVKPRIANWRYIWHRENYTLLGTDINWLARGNCGSVYPAGKNMYLWEMLKRGNREKLSREEVQKVIDHGRKYFEPYGPEYVERFTRHVPHNLLSRHGKKMVFYYNRASCQLFPEFQTFQDEWCLTDYRTVGPGNSVGEIKIVPSASYIDHALHWYGKSFAIGGNQGVYWDNMYLRASYNTAMTAAYEQPDGAIMPSNGIWGLRELAKRTFIYMNERGMRPITMAHMTSTGILPILSFCTVQYDWEWKYSQGDVQYRFPREYILLVSTGELAGTWPVLLGDHGKLARDEWTQRTFAGVCLVHELDGWGGGKAWDTLFQHVHRLVETPGLEVYRYWDDRPQPVDTGHPDLPAIVYSLPGKEAIIGVTSYAEQAVDATIEIDPRPLGLQKGYRVTDAETG
ncbi:MAG: glycoside hydrolase domain-containing protein, partial [Planctomycetota bacterium]